jgi:hypothetical protein
MEYLVSYLEARDYSCLLQTCIVTVTVTVTVYVTTFSRLLCAVRGTGRKPVTE